MSVRITISSDFVEKAAGFEKTVHGRMREISANALNNVAFGARAAVQKEIKSAFRSPKPITVNSVRVRKVNDALPVAEQFAEVYITDDIPGMTTRPDKYLLTQEGGGERRAKRSERALQIRGYLQSTQQFVPGPAAKLDSFGQLSGSGITQLLSRTRSFSTAGFDANTTTASFRKSVRSSAAKTARLQGLSRGEIKAARDGAYIPATKQNGTDFFAARSKRGAGFMGIFQLVSKGAVKPVLWFTTKRPNYSARFPFKSVVREFAAANMARNMASAARYVLRK